MNIQTSTKIALTASLLAAGLLVANTVSAHGGFRPRGGFQHHHSRAHVGIFIGAPLLAAPWYYYPQPRYYYPPTVIVPAQPPVYIEQPQAQVQEAPPVQQADNYWYYCRDTQAYYPYVDRCASPWQRVIPQPPPS